MLLALDMASATGWAVSDGATTQSGTIVLKHPYKDKGMPDALLFVRFWQKLVEFNDLFRLTGCIYEEVQAGSAKGRQAVITFGLRAILLKFCKDHDIPCTGIGPSAWKKKSVGKGNAAKQETMDAMRKLGHAPETFDESDALGILESTRVINVPRCKIKFISPRAPVALARKHGARGLAARGRDLRPRRERQKHPRQTAH